MGTMTRRRPREPGRFGPLCLLGAALGVGLALAEARPARAATDPDDEPPASTRPAPGAAQDTAPTSARGEDAKPSEPAKPQGGPASAQDGASGAARDPSATARPEAQRPVLDALTGEALRPHGLSWDARFAGVPAEGALVEGELGFSGLPRVAYHHTLVPGLSLGAMVAFDFAYWAPELAFTSSLLVQAPIRITLQRTPSMSVGLRLEPGIGFFDRHQFTVGILANAGATVGWTVEDRLILGAGLDLPLDIWLPTGGARAFVSLPILVGPVAEFHVTPPLALTFDLKMGPHITAAAEGGGTVLGLRMMAGIAYRL